MVNDPFYRFTLWAFCGAYLFGSIGLFLEAVGAVPHGFALAAFENAVLMGVGAVLGCLYGVFHPVEVDD